MAANDIASMSHWGHSMSRWIDTNRVTSMNELWRCCVNESVQVCKVSLEIFKQFFHNENWSIATQLNNELNYIVAFWICFVGHWSLLIREEGTYHSWNVIIRIHWRQQQLAKWNSTYLLHIDEEKKKAEQMQHIWAQFQRNGFTKNVTSIKVQRILRVSIRLDNSLFYVVISLVPSISSIARYFLGTRIMVSFYSSNCRLFSFRVFI